MHPRSGCEAGKRAFRRLLTALRTREAHFFGFCATVLIPIRVDPQNRFPSGSAIMELDGRDFRCLEIMSTPSLERRGAPDVVNFPGEGHCYSARVEGENVLSKMPETADTWSPFFMISNSAMVSMKTKASFRNRPSTHETLRQDHEKFPRSKFPHNQTDPRSAARSQSGLSRRDRGERSV